MLALGRRHAGSAGRANLVGATTSRGAVRAVVDRTRHTTESVWSQGRGDGVVVLANDPDALRGGNVRVGLVIQLRSSGVGRD